MPQSSPFERVQAVFSVFTELRNNPLNLMSQPFRHPRKKLTIHSQSRVIRPFPSSAPSTLCLYLPTWVASCKQNRVTRGLVYTASFTWGDVLKSHRCRSAWQNSVSNGRKTAFAHLSFDGCSGGLRDLSVTDEAAANRPGESLRGRDLPIPRRAARGPALEKSRRGRWAPSPRCRCFSLSLSSFLLLLVRRISRFAHSFAHFAHSFTRPPSKQ